MKLKIDNIWIPVSLLLLILSGVAIAIFLNDFVGGIIITASVLALFFIYFPWLTVSILRKNHPEKEKIINGIGLFGLTTIFTGILFKQFHLPGAGVLAITGSFVIALNYLPAWFFLSGIGKTWKIIFYNFIFVSFVGFLVLHFVFKLQHWPFGNIFGVICFWLLVLFVLYWAIMFFILRDRSAFKLNYLFVFGFLIAYFISGIQATRMTSDFYNSQTTNQDMADKNLNLYRAKNKFLYDAFEANNIDDTTFLNYKLQATRLKALSDSVSAHIRKVRTEIVALTEEIPRAVADTTSYENIRMKSAFDFVNEVLIGSDVITPDTGMLSGYKLKMKLRQFKKSVENLCPAEMRLQFVQSNPLVLDSVVYDDETVDSWEVSKFYHVPLGTAYTTLTSLMSDVKYSEMLVLTELFNRATSNQKGNIAAQLAELSVKYEAEKKEKEISLLKKDKELNDTKLKAKDDEISQREKTITYFAFAILAFLVLIVFVIRSNILRRKANKTLQEQKDVIMRQKSEVEQQKYIVEEKNKEILDSINYAKRLQEAILPPLNEWQQHLPGSFILYKPKDIVAGDFYWMEKVENKTLFAAADCTGHGVPGALVSVVCSNALNRAVKEFNITQPSKILDKVRSLVIETFEKSESEVMDGMDISLASLERRDDGSFNVEWAGANNPIWFISNNEHREIFADKQPIGKYAEEKPFTNHKFVLQKNDILYLFTDGYADQFGGPKGKKFKYKQLQQLLSDISGLRPEIQKEKLLAAFESWKGIQEQIDDVCVIGVRI